MQSARNRTLLCCSHWLRSYWMLLVTFDLWYDGVALVERTFLASQTVVVPSIRPCFISPQPTSPRHSLTTRLLPPRPMHRRSRFHSHHCALFHSFCQSGVELSCYCGDEWLPRLAAGSTAPLAVGDTAGPHSAWLAPVEGKQQLNLTASGAEVTLWILVPLVARAGAVACAGNGPRTPRSRLLHRMPIVQPLHACLPESGCTRDGASHVRAGFQNMQCSRATTP